MNRARINTRRRETPSIWRKIAAARRDVQPVQRHGEATNYDFVKAEDVVVEANRVLDANGLVVIPSIDGSKLELGERGGIVKAAFTFEVIDVDTGCSIEKTWISYGEDVPGDKAIYKAITGAIKYFLTSFLSIPVVGSDPEYDGAPPAEQTPAERAKAGAEAARRKHIQDRDAEQSDPPAPEPVDVAPTEAKEPARVAG